MKCPVCGETAIEAHRIEPGASIRFEDVYYGADTVCIAVNTLYAHGERL